MNKQQHIGMENINLVVSAYEFDAEQKLTGLITKALEDEGMIYPDILGEKVEVQRGSFTTTYDKSEGYHYTVEFEVYDGRYMIMFGRAVGSMSPLPAEGMFKINDLEIDQLTITAR
ncbi:MAG: hypothetical protein ACP5RJ_07800 [Conexivisphaera sp.]